jgi:hypothetical protein
VIAVLPAVAGIAGAMGAKELVMNDQWFSRRKALYGLAQAAARRRGKPLLVVGRPRGRDHG